MKKKFFVALVLALLCAWSASAQPCRGTPTVASLEPGLYSIRLANGRALDEDYGQWEPGTKAHGWDFHGGHNQLWFVTKVGGNYLIRSAATAKALDISWNCHTAVGCSAITWPMNKGQSQIFRINSVDGGAQIILVDGGHQLGLEGGGSRNGDRAVLGPMGCGAHQLWRLNRIGSITETVPPYDVRMGMVLNNYTPYRNRFDGSGERAFYSPNSSWIELSAFGQSLGRAQFDIPVQEVGPDRMWKVYINDFAYNRSVAAKLPVEGERGELKFTLRFEEAGTEILSDCYNNFLCAGAGAPAFDLRNITLTVRMKVGFDQASRRFTYQAHTEFAADMNESSICVNNAFAFLCDWFLPDRASLIRQIVTDFANQRVNDPSLRTPFELFLNSASGSHTRAVVGQGGELVFF